MTACPIFFPVMTPKRGRFEGGKSTQFRIKQPCARRRPCTLALAKSRPCLMRRSRGNPNGAGEEASMNGAGSDRGEALAAHPAAVAQRGLAALRGVTIQETVLTFAPDFRWLILSFHAVFDLNFLPALQKIRQAVWSTAGSSCATGGERVAVNKGVSSIGPEADTIENQAQTRAATAGAPTSMERNYPRRRKLPPTCRVRCFRQ